MLLSAWEDECIQEQLKRMPFGMPITHETWLWRRARETHVHQVHCMPCAQCKCCVLWWSCVCPELTRTCKHSYTLNSLWILVRIWVFSNYNIALAVTSSQMGWSFSLYLYPGDDVLQRCCTSIRCIRAPPTMQNIYWVQYTDIALRNIAKVPKVALPCHLKYSEGPKLRCSLLPQMKNIFPK